MMQPLPLVGGLTCNARLEVVERRDGRLSGGAVVVPPADRRQGRGTASHRTGPALRRRRPAGRSARRLPAASVGWLAQIPPDPARDGPPHRLAGNRHAVPRRPPAPAGRRLLRGDDARARRSPPPSASGSRPSGVALFPFTFYVACVARAQDRVFRHRGQQPPGYGISVPIQTRKRGARGPLFHNHVAVLYFNPRREHLGTLEATAAAMKTQFAAMTRKKISESFDAVLDLMRRAADLAFPVDHPRAVQGRDLLLLPFVHRRVCSGVDGIRRVRASPTPTISPAWAPRPAPAFSSANAATASTSPFPGARARSTTTERQLMVAQLRADLLGEPQP